MTRDELEHHGFRIRILKRRWYVEFHHQLVARGKIGGKYDARNQARKEALEAATVAYVKERMKGTKLGRPLVTNIMGYAGARLLFDGGRVFTMRVAIKIPGLQEQSPQFWAALREKAPEIVQRHILHRLKGEY